MITVKQVEAGEVHEGSRVFYTRKDGSRIYGTVRHIYLEKEMISIKPDEPIKVGTNNTYPQTFRFIGLTPADKPVDIQGTRVSPLVVFIGAKDIHDDLRKVYSCKDGLFVTDGNRMFMEKVRGLSDGYMKEEFQGYKIFKIDKASIDQIVFNADMIKKSKVQAPVTMYYNTTVPESEAYIEVNKDQFNRSIKAINYSGGYYTKDGDYVKVKFDNGKVNVICFDRKSKQYDDVNIKSGVVKGKGTCEVEVMLLHLKDFTKGIKTGVYQIGMNNDMMIIETDKQKRIQFDKTFIWLHYKGLSIYKEEGKENEESADGSAYIQR